MVLSDYFASILRAIEKANGDSNRTRKHEFFCNLMRAIYEKNTSEIKFWRQLRQQPLREDWKIASKSLFSSLIE